MGGVGQPIMPEPDDHSAPPPPDAVADEGGVVLPEESDGAAPALDNGPGRTDEPAGREDGRARARPGRLGRTLWWVGAIGFAVNLVLFASKFAGWVPHGYPDLPVAVGFMVLIYIGRGLMIQARHRAPAADGAPGTSSRP
jgi:hypothetical protein